MKTIKSILTILLFSIFLNNNATCKNMTGGEEKAKVTDYEMVKNELGIRVFTRWIPIDESRSGKEVKAVFEIEGTIPMVLSQLNDDKNFTKWMGGTKDYYRVKTIDPRHWYSYIQFALPWPLHNQDIIINYEVVDELSSNTKTYIRMTGVPAYLKKFDGVTRIQHFEGSWTFTNLGNNKVRVEYIMFSNQKPVFPLWITDPIIQNNLVKSMDAFHGKINERNVTRVCCMESH